MGGEGKEETRGGGRGQKGFVNISYICLKFCTFLKDRWMSNVHSMTMDNQPL